MEPTTELAATPEHAFADWSVAEMRRELERRQMPTDECSARKDLVDFMRLSTLSGTPRALIDLKGVELQRELTRRRMVKPCARVIELTQYGSKKQLMERMENWNFTQAIDSFGAAACRRVLRRYVDLVNNSTKYEEDHGLPRRLDLKISGRVPHLS